MHAIAHCHHTSRIFYGMLYCLLLPHVCKSRISIIWYCAAAYWHHTSCIFMGAAYCHHTSLIFYGMRCLLPPHVYVSPVFLWYALLHTATTRPVFLWYALYCLYCYKSPVFYIIIMNHSGQLMFCFVLWRRCRMMFYNFYRKKNSLARP